MNSTTRSPAIPWGQAGGRAEQRGRLTSRPYECALLPPTPSRTKSRRSHRTCGAAQVSGSIPPARGASRRRSRGVPPTPAIAPGCLLHSALAEVVLDALRTTSLPQRMGTIGAAGSCCEGWPMRPPCNPFCQRPLARGEAGGVPLADARDASRGERRGEKPFPLSAPHGIGTCCEPCPNCYTSVTAPIRKPARLPSVAGSTDRMWRRDRSRFRRSPMPTAFLPCRNRSRRLPVVGRVLSGLRDSRAQDTSETRESYESTCSPFPWKSLLARLSLSVPRRIRFPRHALPSPPTVWPSGSTFKGARNGH